MRLIDGTNEVIQNLQRLRSPSPDTEGMCHLFPGDMAVAGMDEGGSHTPAPKTGHRPTRHNPFYVTTGCRAPVPSKGKQQIGAVSCGKRSIETQILGCILHCRRVQFDHSFGPAGITYSRPEWVAYSPIFSLLLSRCKVHMHRTLFIGHQEVFVSRNAIPVRERHGNKPHPGCRLDGGLTLCHLGWTGYANAGVISPNSKLTDHR